MIRTNLLLIALLLMVPLAEFTGAAAQPPAGRLAALQRGVNMTGWFRFPASRDPAVLDAWLSDTAMRDLHAVGFTFVRVAVDPILVADAPIRATLVGSVRRLQRAGLATVISLHPNGWALETSADDRKRLHDAWRMLALALRSLDPAMTFPELLNEPVFANNASDWQGLQHALLAEVREVLPASTVVLTGADWGSIAGLLCLTPEADSNVVYSFHYYDPVELTTLAAYRPGLDRSALAQLPFPTDEPARCAAMAEQTVDAPTRDLMRFYCAMHWDRPRIEAAIDQAASWGQRFHAALLAGEFGASAALNRFARLAWLRSVRESCVHASIGWALWGYDDVMGFAITRPPPPKLMLNGDVLAALGLPLAQRSYRRGTLTTSAQGNRQAAR